MLSLSKDFLKSQVKIGVWRLKEVGEKRRQIWILGMWIERETLEVSDSVFW